MANNITPDIDPEFYKACILINLNWHEAFDREHAIDLLERADIAPNLRREFAEMTFEEFEGFTIKYLGG